MSRRRGLPTTLAPPSYSSFVDVPIVPALSYAACPRQSPTGPPLPRRGLFAPMGAPRAGTRVPGRGGGKKALPAAAAAAAPPPPASARRRPRVAKGSAAAAVDDADADAPPAGPTTHLRFDGLGGAGQDEAAAAADAGAAGARVPLTGAMAASLCVDRRKLVRCVGMAEKGSGH